MFIKTPSYCTPLIFRKDQNNKVVVIDEHGNELLKTDVNFRVSNMGVTIIDLIGAHNRDLKIDLYTTDYYNLQYSSITINNEFCIIVMIKSDFSSKHCVSIQPLE